VGDVRGFRAALLAAEDAAVPMPRRLVLARPDEPLCEYLAAWSEDVERVRRCLTIGGREGRLQAVVTLSSFGSGVEPSLAIESLTPACDDLDALFRRSGVHPKVDVDAAFAAEVASLEPLGADEAESAPEPALALRALNPGSTSAPEG
jgi:hypothetical protein